MRLSEKDCYAAHLELQSDGFDIRREVFGTSPLPFGFLELSNEMLDEGISHIFAAARDCVDKLPAIIITGTPNGTSNEIIHPEIARCRAVGQPTFVISKATDSPRGTHPRYGAHRDQQASGAIAIELLNSISSGHLKVIISKLVLKGYLGEELIKAVESITKADSPDDFKVMIATKEDLIREVSAARHRVLLRLEQQFGITL